METTLERLKRILKDEFDGYDFGMYKYTVETQSNSCVDIYINEERKARKLFCIVNDRYTAVIDSNVAIPHKLTMLIAKALQAPQGMYKKPTVKLNCPKCNSWDIATKRRSDGYYECNHCNYKWRNV